MSNPNAATASAAAAADSPAARHISKLPVFWMTSPAAWFCVVEGQFALNNITDQMQRYYLVINALSKANVDMVH
jgi:hypothetical protein